MAPLVLLNVTEMASNSYLARWMAAARASGAELVQLGRRTALGRRRPDWVHLQWPEHALLGPTRTALVELARVLGYTAAARLRGARVLLTAHNVTSHDGRHPRLEALLWRALGPLVSDLHVMSEPGGEAFVAAQPQFARARRHWIPLGNYRDLVADPPDPGPTRAALSADPATRLLATFGQLKPYKGVEALLAAVAATDDPRLRLVVAGAVPDPGVAAAIADATARDARVVARTRFLPEAELVALVAAADLVVLPYARVLNSASALLALSAGTRVLLPRTPTFEDLADRVGPGWVELFDPPLRAEHLVVGPAPHGAPELAWCDWEAIAARLHALWAS